MTTIITTHDSFAKEMRLSSSPGAAASAAPAASSAEAALEAKTIVTTVNMSTFQEGNCHYGLGHVCRSSYIRRYWAMNHNKASRKTLLAHWTCLQNTFPEYVLTIRCEKVNEVNEKYRMGCQDYDVTDHMAKTTTFVNLIMRRKRSESAR